MAFFHILKIKTPVTEFFDMKNTKGSYMGLIAFIIVLIIANGYLVNRNNSFKEKNRELLLQNDSLQSVNLILQNTIDTVYKKNRSSENNGKLTIRQFLKNHHNTIGY